ncbi:MAG: GNAT family N-acetyltransferase [Anaerolineae bacterium]
MSVPAACHSLCTRPFLSSDLLHIRRILLAIGWAERYIAGSERAATGLASRADARVNVALIDGVPAGFCAVEHHAWNNLAQIQWLAVDPLRQRQGIARAMVAQAEIWARAQGARGIYLDTPVGNVGGRAFYDAVGFVAAYIMPRYYDDETDGVTYQRWFDDAASRMSASDGASAGTEEDT